VGTPIHAHSSHGGEGDGTATLSPLPLLLSARSAFLSFSFPLSLPLLDPARGACGSCWYRYDIARLTRRLPSTHTSAAGKPCPHPISSTSASIRRAERSLQRETKKHPLSPRSCLPCERSWNARSFPEKNQHRVRCARESRQFAQSADRDDRRLGGRGGGEKEDQEDQWAMSRPECGTTHSRSRE